LQSVENVGTGGGKCFILFIFIFFYLMTCRHIPT